MKVAVYYEKLIAPKGSGGGAERVAIEEAKHLGGRLLTFEADPQVLSYAGPGGVKNLEIIGGGALREGFVERANLKSLLLTLARIVFLWAAIRRLRPDVIITSWKGGWLSVFIVTRLTRTPYIIHYAGTTFWFNRGAESFIKYSLIHKSKFEEIRKTHLEPIPTTPPRGPTRIALEVFAALDYMSVRKAAAILVNSNRLSREMRSLYSVESIALPITAIRPSFGEPSAKLELQGGGEFILSVCRLEPEKRVDVLIRALSLLRKKGENVTLVVVGIGSLMEKLRGLAKQLGVEGSVRFVGFVPEAELASYYRSCDLFAFAGWADFVLTVYEALSAGKRVVCSTELDLADDIAASGMVARSEPTPEAFAKVMLSTLARKENTQSETSFQTWDNYLKRIREICVAASEHRKPK